MPKQAPSPARVAAMLIFALSCFGIVLFLWITFGGSTPLKPNEYEVNASFPEATTLAQEADVRISGVNVGRVKSKKIAPGSRMAPPPPHAGAPEGRPFARRVGFRSTPHNLANTGSCRQGESTTPCPAGV